jgi:hypothetical protein
MIRRTVHYVVAEMGKSAGIPFPVHPHTLTARHRVGKPDRSSPFARPY